MLICVRHMIAAGVQRKGGARSGLASGPIPAHAPPSQPLLNSSYKETGRKSSLFFFSSSPIFFFAKGDCVSNRHDHGCPQNGAMLAGVFHASTCRSEEVGLAHDAHEFVL